MKDADVGISRGDKICELKRSAYQLAAARRAITYATNAAVRAGWTSEQDFTQTLIEIIELERHVATAIEALSVRK